MLEILIPGGIGMPTGGVLAKAVRELGVPVHANVTSLDNAPSSPIVARVCWGIAGSGRLPHLNKAAGGMDKLTELAKFHRAGIPAPMYWTEPPTDEVLYPILGRSSCHAEGKDIKVYENRDAARRATCRYFTRVIESDKEYRIWVFKDSILGIYLREKTWPVEREGFGRNWWSGWGFTLLDNDEIGRSALDYAKQAVEARGLDFGAVDVLHSIAGRYYVLEVNSAPGANKYCTRALNALAREIKDWYQNL